MINKKIIACIPARLESTRLERKLLLPLGSKSLIETVYDKVVSFQLFDDVHILVDDEILLDHCLKFTNQVFVTGKHHKSGTERIGEHILELNSDIILNIQADEPLIQKSDIVDLLELITQENINIASLYFLKEQEENINNIPSEVKLVTDLSNKAIYFSRSLVPYHQAFTAESSYKIHIGIYAFKYETLLKLSKLTEGSLYKIERLEQLQWVENGFEVYVKEVSSPKIGVDTLDDYNSIKRILNL